MLTTWRYLAVEQDRDRRHEFIDGVIVAMVGGSDEHNAIAGSLAGLLQNQRTEAAGTTAHALAVLVVHEAAVAMQCRRSLAVGGGVAATSRCGEGGPGARSCPPPGCTSNVGAAAS
jgi:hypothetical protein